MAQGSASGSRRRSPHGGLSGGGFEQLSSSVPSRGKLMTGFSPSFAAPTTSGVSGGLGLGNSLVARAAKEGAGNSSKRSSSLGNSVKEDELDEEKKLFQDDILFDMEGYNNQDGCQPFFESDDESESEYTCAAYFMRYSL